MYCDVKLYAKTSKPGQIKRAGRAPRVPDWAGVYWDHWLQWQNHDAPEFVVMDRIRQGIGPGDCRDPPRVDREVLNRDVWNRKESQNVSCGEFCNEDIAIKYEYDLGGERLRFRVGRDENADSFDTNSVVGGAHHAGR